MAKATELLATDIIGQMNKPDEGGEDYRPNCIASGKCNSIAVITFSRLLYFIEGTESNITVSANKFVGSKLVIYAFAARGIASGRCGTSEAALLNKLYSLSLISAELVW